MNQELCWIHVLRLTKGVNVSGNQLLLLVRLIVSKLLLKVLPSGWLGISCLIRGCCNDVALPFSMKPYLPMKPFLFHCKRQYVSLLQIWCFKSANTPDIVDFTESQNLFNRQITKHHMPCHSFYFSKCSSLNFDQNFCLLDFLLLIDLHIWVDVIKKITNELVMQS